MALARAGPNANVNVDASNRERERILYLGLALGLEGSAQGLAMGMILHASTELKKKDLYHPT